MSRFQLMKIRLWEVPLRPERLHARFSQVLEVELAGGRSGFGEFQETAVQADLLKILTSKLSTLNGLHWRAFEKTLDDILTPDQTRLRLAIDVALMDARSRILGCPLSGLLGGKARSKVNFTAHVDLTEGFKKEDPDTVLDVTLGQLEDLARTGTTRRILVRVHESSADRALHFLHQFAGTVDNGLEISIDLGGEFSSQRLRRLCSSLDALRLALIIDPGRDLDETLAIGRSGKFGGRVAVCRPLAGTRVLGRALMSGGASAVVLDPYRWGGLRRLAEALAVCRSFSVPTLLLATQPGPTCSSITHVCAADPWAVSSVVMSLPALDMHSLRAANGMIELENEDPFHPHLFRGARLLEPADGAVG